MTEKKAIVIGIDGAQLEKLDETSTPNLDSLNIIESFTGGIQGTETEQQTFSGPGWGTLLTGVWANKHGIVANDDTLRANPEYPSIFEYVHNDDPDNYIASVVNWGPINAYFEEDVNSIVDFELTAPEPTDDNLAQDNIIAPTVADLILEEAPDYTFVHLDNVDVVGHELGFSDEYLESITQADGHVGTILDAVEEREAANPDEDWLVIVTTDHGREPPEGFDHGGQTDSERTTFIASNQELDDSSIAPATDVVPTVLDHLGIEGGDFDGESLLESQLESEVEPVDQILEIWQDATIDYALVVAHRGGYYENGVTTIPENSFPAIEQSIDLGVEMIELDVWKTEDDRYVIIHDETVDRTTTGSGSIDEFTLDELKELNLIIEDTGEVTSEKIPTLEEAFEAVEGEIMLNIDIKLPVEELVNVMNIAREMDVDEQIVIKNPVNNEEQFEAVQETLSQLPFPVKFMPIIDDDLVSAPEFIVEVFEEFQPDAAEILVRPQGEGQEPIEDPGFLFSEEVREIAAEYDVRLWINTLFANPGISDNGFINGFRNDVLALTEPNEVYAFWVDAGASILQTDEPLLAIDYLNNNGLREPITDEPPVSPSPIFGTVDADTLKIEGSNNLVFAGEGNDLVDASLAVGNNRIYGDGGDDTFILGADDRLVGAEGAESFFVTSGGNNIITGGADADRFWIANAELPESANIITDFMSGEDVIGIAGLGIGFDRLSITQNGDDALIGNDAQDLAILSGVDANSLNADNFVFV